MRDEDFLKIKTEDQPPGTDLFEVFVFIKNIKVKDNYRYGDIELIPYHEYVCLSEVSIINDYMRELGIQINFDKDLNASIRPSAIAHIDNIQSGDGIAAEDLAIKKTMILCGIFSYLTYSKYISGDLHFVCTVFLAITK